MKIRILALVALSIACQSSFADWVPRLQSQVYTGTIAYNGKSVSVSEGMTGKMGQLAAKVYALPVALKTSIDDWIKASATARGASFNASSLSGPINASISGLTGPLQGYNRISFSGPSYSATLTATGSKWGIGYTCTATWRATDVAASLVYEPYSGQVLPDASLSSLQLNASSSTSCSTDVDWIPILGDLIDDFAARKADAALVSGVNRFAATAMQAVIPAGPSFLGIYDVVPVNAYVVDGVDLGQYLKNNFASLFAGRTLSLRLGPFVPGPVVYGNGDPEGRTIVSNVVTVDFSDTSTSLSFAVKDIRSYQYTFVCSVRNPGQTCRTP